MHTPAAALAWELWRKHHQRVMTIVGLVLGFALLYPKLCAMIGFNPDRPNPLDELANIMALHNGPAASPLRVVRSLYVLFLACGPTLAMFITFLYVAGIFTFCEFDSETKDPMKFPQRLFALPVSTPFLFWFLWLGGIGALAALHSGWVFFVRLPRLEPFGIYHNWFGWMTLLVLTQGIAWALAAWPNTRLVLLMALLFGFLFSPTLQDTFRSPMLLPPLFVLGSVLARVGLSKMRHTQWQGWAWAWSFKTTSSNAELPAPKRFASPTQAQLWFEWRRSARSLCFIAAVLALVPVILHVLVRIMAGWNGLSGNTMIAFPVYLVSIPMFLLFLFAASPARMDPTFLMLRPMTNGQMMMAMLKATAISTIFSWLVVLLALAALPLLGDFRAVVKALEIPARYWIIIVPGVMLLTWRLIAVNLCFVWSGKRRLMGMPVLLVMGTYASAVTISILSQHEALWDSFCRLVPGVLAGLIVIKFLLAYLAFRVSLKRGLLAPSAAISYLCLWALLAAILLIPVVILWNHTPLFLPFSLGIVLLVPLARIGFCPITLAWNRHC